MHSRPMPRHAKEATRLCSPVCGHDRTSVPLRTLQRCQTRSRHSGTDATSPTTVSADFRSVCERPSGSSFAGPAMDHKLPGQVIN